MPQSMAWFLQGLLNMLATHLFVWKAHQLGACGPGLISGRLHWAGTHDCDAVCCIMLRTARFHFMVLAGTQFSFWCLSLRVGHFRPFPQLPSIRTSGSSVLPLDKTLSSVCPQLVTCL